jgi:hypothetical protein
MTTLMTNIVQDNAALLVFVEDCWTKTCMLRRRHQSREAAVIKPLGVVTGARHRQCCLSDLLLLPPGQDVLDSRDTEIVLMFAYMSWEFKT